MKTITLLISAFLSLGLFFSCQKKKPIIKTKGGELNYLVKTQNIGMIAGFNPDNPPATADSIEVAWNEAIAAGMRTGRLQLDWPDIEPEKGVYDEAFVLEQMNRMQSDGLSIHLLVSAYDSEGLDVPDYLSGRAIDDPEVISRFNQLMTWIIPLFVERGGYAISVSNEPDNIFQDDEKLADQMIRFFEPVQDHIHTLDENMGVSITMSFGNLKHSRKEMKKIMKLVDYACFNFYGSDFLLDQPYSTAENEINIGEMIEFSGSKNIVIQELGLHTDDSLMNSSEQLQRDFFDTFFNKMEQESQIKAAYIFQMVDWSPTTVEIFNALFESDVPQSFIDEYSAILKTIGLIDFETGQRKLAWKTVIEWIKKFN